MTLATELGMTAPAGGEEKHAEGQGEGEGEGEEDRRARNIGVGCFTAFAGFWSGGMVAVLIGRIVEGIRGSPSCEGLPICNWGTYAVVGALIGAITLPVLVLRRLRSSRR